MQDTVQRWSTRGSMKFPLFLVIHSTTTHPTGAVGKQTPYLTGHNDYSRFVDLREGEGVDLWQGGLKGKRWSVCGWEKGQGDWGPDVITVGCRGDRVQGRSTKFWAYGPSFNYFFFFFKYDFYMFICFFLKPIWLLFGALVTHQVPLYPDAPGRRAGK